MSLPCFTDIKTSSIKNIKYIKSTVDQGLTNLKGVLQQVEKTYDELINYILELQALNEKCVRQCCSGTDLLKKEIASKDNVIQSVASALTTLNESQNFSVPSEIFQILCGESTSLSSQPNKSDIVSYVQNIVHNNPPVLHDNSYNSPKKDNYVKSNVESKDESLSEIEGTPTGRTSPIIQAKKRRNGSTPVKSVSTTSEKNLKKSHSSWPTSENALKLSFPTPSRNKGGKLRQSRLNLMQVKKSNLIDVTNSPERLKTFHCHDDKNIKVEIKKESLDEDTILPSPTTDLSELENFKFPKTKIKKLKEENITQCDTNDSISILQNMKNSECKPKIKKSPPSPSKKHLGENINLLNTQNLDEQLESSSSVLGEYKVKTTSLKRKLLEKIEPIYKEATVRKKLEKMALPGWSCEECEKFFAELYKDDLVMLKKKMDECSKHRGRNNPVRPKTPEGLWNPRWNVPEDTEEFNRRNNAV